MPFQEEPMEIESVITQEDWHPRMMFPPREETVDENGNLMVAIYSRQRQRENIQRHLTHDPTNQELRRLLEISTTLIENGFETFVEEEDYFYDVVDDVNMIARNTYSWETAETTLVVGQRIMTWLEFRALTTREEVGQFQTFQEFRNYFCRRE